MKRRCLIFLTAAAILLFPLTAYANSSWGWLTETTPLTILPFAIAGTLIIEISSIIKFGRVQKRLKAAIVIIAANLFSFLTAYFLQTIDTQTGYSVMDMIIHTPLYIVSVLYLVLTLVAELPVVYHLLRRDTDNETRLVVTIIISNVLTTVLVFACEKLFAPGAW